VKALLLAIAATAAGPGSLESGTEPVRLVRSDTGVVTLRTGVDASCRTGPCALAVVVTGRGVRLGRLERSVGAGKRLRIVLRPSRRGIVVLRRAPRTRVSIDVTLTPSGAEAIGLERIATVRRPAGL
jgi:hypothetical protein